MNSSSKLPQAVKIDADAEKKQEPTPNRVALGQEYGQTTASREKTGLFARIIDGFREHPQYFLLPVSNCGEAEDDL